jgi:hypothetical protein
MLVSDFINGRDDTVTAVCLSIVDLAARENTSLYPQYTGTAANPGTS